jgi:HPt (histidine-containing phosphotransfer) domain-containing protein
MNEHVPKPIDPAQLFTTLSRWLKSSNRIPQQATETDDVALPENLPGIDLQWGLERIGGNKRLFLKLLGDFAANHRNAIEIIEQRLSDGMPNDARRELHTLKGVAGNIGARILHQEAGNLEQALLANELQGSSLPKSFRDAFTSLFDGLSALQTTGQSPATASKVLEPAAADGDPAELLHQLHQLLNEGNPNAKALLAPLGQLLTEGRQQEQLQQIGLLLENYEFDLAMEVLKKISSSITGDNR